MKDMTHQPICIYMEVLSRLLDARRVMDLRWFLSAIDVAHSDLLAKQKEVGGPGGKGKKAKK